MTAELPPGDGTVPALSIVVGSRAADGGAAACLAALHGQAAPGVEVLLVEDAPEPSLDAGVSRRLVVPGALVPELWAEGIRQATGRLVGLLAGGVVPDPDWVALTLELHKGGAAAFGGAVEPGAGMRLVDWAVYFCRYAPYMRPVPADADLEIPADNASYDGDILRRYAHLYEDAFFEPFVHRAMRADGCELRFDPSRAVRVARGAGAAAFCRQRFRHGREHGRLRSAGLPRAAVLASAATAPLVPLVMTLRAARQVAARRRHVARFAAVAPLVLGFYTCWAAGELLGRLAVAAGRDRTR